MIPIDPTQFQTIGVAFTHQFTSAFNYDSFGRILEAGKGFFESVTSGSISTTSSTSLSTVVGPIIFKVAPIITMTGYLCDPISFAGHFITDDVERQLDDTSEKVKPALKKLKVG